jgi:hypothetical protein
MSTTNDGVARLHKKPGRASRAAAAATVNGGGWKRRKVETLTCPSGEKVQIRRPGPEFMLRAGKVARTFSQVSSHIPEVGDGLSDHERGLQVIAEMSDTELAAVMIFARELVCAILVSPRLVQNPQSEDEIGPDDIGDDFWFLFNYAMTGFFNLRVPVGNQEVEVGDLKSFRPDAGVPGDSVDSAQVRSDPE